MKRPAIRPLALAIALLASLGVYACNGPCRTLAEKICQCEFNVRERAACLQEVDANGDARQPTQEEEEVCEDLLETCTCDALEREDYVQCGLTKPPRPSTP